MIPPIRRVNEPVQKGCFWILKRVSFEGSGFLLGRLVSRTTPHVKSHERGPTTPVRELTMVANYLQVTSHWMVLQVRIPFDFQPFIGGPLLTIKPFRGVVNQRVSTQIPFPNTPVVCYIYLHERQQNVWYLPVVYIYHTLSVWTWICCWIINSSFMDSLLKVG